jgi:predicted protein tyrosine phosphatase
MTAVIVCPLSQIAPTVAAHGARHLVSLINLGTPVPRPEAISAENHLFIGINDITEAQEGMVLPDELHVRQLIAFAATWDRASPMVIHCFAGISRSTAAAVTTLALLAPGRDERDIALSLRAASPTATPNARIVALADRLLGRDGRLIEAIAGIGRGVDAMESVPFRLPLDTSG